MSDEPQEQSPVYARMPDGWELIGHADPDALRAEFEPQPDIEAAMRYISARYKEAVSWAGIANPVNLASLYGKGSPFAMGYSVERRPELTDDGKCVNCGIHFYLCEACCVWWAGSHVCEVADEHPSS
jgi:hypothetical protein